MASPADDLTGFDAVVISVFAVGGNDSVAAVNNHVGMGQEFYELVAIGFLGFGHRPGSQNCLVLFLTRGWRIVMATVKIKKFIKTVGYNLCHDNMSSVMIIDSLPRAFR